MSVPHPSPFVGPRRRLPNTVARLVGAFDEAWLRLLLAVCRKAPRGRLRVTLPDRRELVFAGGQPGPDADLVIRAPRTARRLLLGGRVAAIRSFLEEDWDSPDLTALFGWVLANEAELWSDLKGWAVPRLLNRARHRRNANTRAGSRRNIAFHYDLGNAFYAEWLDAGMQYSSGIHADPADSLEAAQARKLARIGELLRLEPGMKVLEIGCGWGGLARHLAATHGVEVVGITLSREQRDHARAAVAAEGLSGQVDIRLQDYRDVEGRFDRIVSIEMLEAVGEENWRHYFDRLRHLLVPGGHAVVQTITIADERFESYQRSADFIQSLVFPGGMLPCPRALTVEAALAGLRIDHSETFGESYAWTLAAWHRRFDAAWPRIRGLGFDETFQRLWRAYLAYCEAGFRAGRIDVGLYRFVPWD